MFFGAAFFIALRYETWHDLKATSMNVDILKWANKNLSPIEHFVVVLICHASKREVRRLRLFLQEWERQND